MDKKNKIDLLMGLSEKLENIKDLDRDALDKFRKRGEMIFLRLYGPEHHYTRDFFNIKFYKPPIGPSVYQTDTYISVWNRGKKKMMTLLDTAKEEIELFDIDDQKDTSDEKNGNLMKLKGTKSYENIRLGEGMDMKKPSGRLGGHIMDKEQKIKMLNDQIQKVKEAEPSKKNYNELKREVETLFRYILRNPEPLIERIQRRKFQKDKFLNNKVDYWNSHTIWLNKILTQAIKEVETFQQETSHKPNEVLQESNRIFIVHGHDEGMKESVSRFLEKIGLEPIILHEKPGAGKTIIEKFESHSEDCNVAIVLLSPDDRVVLGENRIEDTNEEDIKYRARQNVIFELGFFIGKLSRSQVIPMYKVSEKFEMPSDYDGVIYIPYDPKNEGWKVQLVRELKSCGYVEANTIIR